MEPGAFERVADKVAIVGFCQPHREWAPYRDPSWEVWGLNRGYIFMPRMERWFEMHGQHIYGWEQRRPGNHMLWLQGFPGPIYMHQVAPEIPNSVAYPLEAVADDIGVNIWRLPDHGQGAPSPGRATPYLSSSIAQEIALAIHMGYQEIGLWGIDLNTTSEYAWQKPGVEHLLGVAAGRGIQVHIPDKCPLLKEGIYGRGYMRPEGEHVGPEQWVERIKALEAQKLMFEKELNELLGARRELDWVLSQMVPGLDHEDLEKRRRTIETAISQIKGQLFQCIGALQETIYWAHQTPAGQDPREALAQLAAQHENGRTNGHQADEGPMGIEGRLVDAGAPVGELVPA